MPSPITTSSDLLRTLVAPTVYLREHWADDWTEYPHLWVKQCEWHAAPQTHRAELIWHYGTGCRQGESEFTAISRLDVLDHWVKISIPQTIPSAGEGEESAADPLLWFGRIARITDDRSGAPGVQMLQCEGMECVLDYPIRESWYDDGAGGKWRVDWGLEHNPRDRGKPHQTKRPQSYGNMAEQDGPDGVRLLCGPDVASYATAERWTTRRIIDYLLEYHTPKNATGDEPIPIELDITAADKYLPLDDCTYDWPRLPTHGRTLRQCLNNLIDRRRLLGYVVEVEEVEDDSDKIILRPFTFMDEIISLPSGGGDWITPNQDERTITPATDLAVTEYRLESIEPVDQVRAVGDRIIFVATLRATSTAANTTICEGWTESQQTDYNSAASGTSGYGDLTRAEKQQRNRDYRASEELTRVYSYFNAAPGWPEDDSGVAWSNPIPDGFYTLMDLDKEEGDRFIYRPALRFEPQLPLRVGYDYSKDLAVYGYGDTTPTQGTWEYLQPLVVFKLHDSLDSTSGKYQVADKLSAGAGIEGLGDEHGRDFSVSVRVQNDAAGVVLRVNGYEQHAIASADFSPCDATDDSDAIPQYNWRDELLITVAFKADKALEKRYPEIVPSTDPTRFRVVDVSARAGFEYIVPLTVIGVDGSGDLIIGTEQYIRDDRKVLEDAARVAYEWYGVERALLTLSYEGAQNAALFRLGELITTVDGAPVRTVITSVKVTISENVKEPHRTTIQTQWAELDVMEIL